jgi:hypothetical protein
MPSLSTSTTGEGGSRPDHLPRVDADAQIIIASSVKPSKADLLPRLRDKAKISVPTMVPIAGLLSAPFQAPGPLVAHPHDKRRQNGGHGCTVDADPDKRPVRQTARMP